MDPNAAGPALGSSKREDSVDESVVAEARAILEDAGSIVVLTGAGISAESGVPTFRGEDGLWKSYRPEELATPQAFRRDARLVWEWYQWRRELIAGCEPNPGHGALARLALSREGVRLITQNVDGLHELAARREAGEGEPDAALPLELHGAIFRVRCTECHERSGHRDPIDATSKETLPSCESCGGLLRPDIVWFGESLDPWVLDESFRLAKEADVCLVVGTSALVQPAASIPLVTLEGGGAIIEVNPQETPLTGAARVCLRGASGEVLPALLEG
ncbi:MAG: NAD-dependent deacylase [Gemmatimonadetes bacterium]|nr:NAD-dependent deacylase [Gemmatimonadota bacterium]